MPFRENIVLVLPVTVPSGTWSKLPLDSRDWQSFQSGRPAEHSALLQDHTLGDRKQHKTCCAPFTDLLDLEIPDNT